MNILDHHASFAWRYSLRFWIHIVLFLYNKSAKSDGDSKEHQNNNEYQHKVMCKTVHKI